MGSILTIVMELVKAGMEVAPYLQKLADSFKGGKIPTQAELDDLYAMEVDLDTRIERPLPPDDGTYA